MRYTPNVTLEIHEENVADRWDLYNGAHALILPRRYGGLSLPCQEALQAGLTVLMTDCEPNRIWPIVPLHAVLGRAQRTPFGYVPTNCVKPVMLAKEIDWLNEDRARLDDLRRRGSDWTQANSWDALRPVYDQLFRKTAYDLPDAVYRP
jgi:hypothetical protein